MGDNGILAVNNGGIIAALVKHAGIHADHACKVNSAGKRSFVGAYYNHMVLVHQQVFLIFQKRAHKLVGRREVIETA